MIQTSREILEVTTRNIENVAASMRALTASYAALIAAAKEDPLYSERIADMALNTQTCFADMGVVAIDACTEVSAAMRETYSASQAA